MSLIKRFIYFFHYKAFFEFFFIFESKTPSLTNTVQEQAKIF